MVQLAIDEDILRYHKTLLVWTMKVDKHKVVAASDKKSLQKKPEEELVTNKVTQVKSSEAKRRKELIDSRL
jgi:hypothetical protein